jgi:hypothetical protein
LGLAILESMARRFLTLVVAAVALAALSVPAWASKGQLSVFQHDEILRGSGEDERAEALDEIDGLGVDVVKVLVNWRALAPGGNSRPDDFDGADPGDYEGDAWAPYDSLVREARSRGMRVMFQLGGLAPDWASTKAPIPGSGRPSPNQFRKFVKAVGTRYSGSYVVDGGGDAPGPAPPEDPDMPLPLPLQADTAQAGTTLPRISLYTVWNEPNLGNWLHPQHMHGRPYAPHHYRRLVKAAKAGLSASGHAKDAMLIGELVPFGEANNRIRPLEFIREMACVNRRYRPYRGRAARKRGCDHFRALPGSGLAHHPYTFAGGPNIGTGSRDDVTIANLPRMVRALNRLGRKNRLKRARMKIWNTEFGYQTNPPDPFQTPIGKVPGFMGLSEWLSYRNRRVASYSQYLLYDVQDTGGFQTGLRFHGGRAKPGVYKAYRLPFFVRLRGARKIQAWGGIRAAGSGSRVTVQVKRGGKWRDLGRATTKKRGYFRKNFRVSRAAKRKYRFQGGGHTSVQLKARRR